MFGGFVLPGFRVFLGSKQLLIAQSKGRAVLDLSLSILEAASASKPEGTQANQTDAGFLNTIK